MNHLVDTDPQDPNSDDKKVPDPEFCASTSLPSGLSLPSTLSLRAKCRVEDSDSERLVMSEVQGSRTVSTLSLSKGRSGEPKELKLLEILIDRSIKRLEDNSCEPRIQDALKAIQLKQKQVKTSDAEKFFWQQIDEIRREESPKLYPRPVRPNSLESQILKTIMGLKDQVKTGILPVKTIADTFNQEKSKQSQSQDPAFRLTYPRIGRILSTIGFRKARTENGASAIVWDEGFILGLSPSQKTESAIECDSKKIKPSSEPSEPSEPSDPSEARETASPLKGDRQDASPDQAADSPRGGDEVKPNLSLCPPRVWSHRH